VLERLPEESRREMAGHPVDGVAVLGLQVREMPPQRRELGLTLSIRMLHERLGCSTPIAAFEPIEELRGRSVDESIETSDRAVPQGLRLAVGAGDRVGRE